MCTHWAQHKCLLSHTHLLGSSNHENPGFAFKRQQLFKIKDDPLGLSHSHVRSDACPSKLRACSLFKLITYGKHRQRARVSLAVGLVGCSHTNTNDSVNLPIKYQRFLDQWLITTFLASTARPGSSVPMALLVFPPAKLDYASKHPCKCHERN